MNRLKDTRKKLKYTLRDLEEITGIARSTLSEIENSKRRMGVTHAERLSPVLDVSIDYLIGTDAIRIVDSFPDAINNVLVMFFESFTDAIAKMEISERDHQLYIIIDELIHRTFTGDDLKLIAGLVHQLANKSSNYRR